MRSIHGIKALIIKRHDECDVGLCGSYMAIVRWLMREHGVLTTESWVADVIAQSTEDGSRAD